MANAEQKDTLTSQNVSINTFSDFIQQLNIFRRHLLTYPEDHPVLTSATEKVLDLSTNLFQDKETVQCAVVKKNLFLGTTQLDSKNRIFQDFATSLSSKGIILLSFKNGLTSREILSFCEFLNFSPEEIHAQGGLEKALKQRRLQNIQALKMDYGAFRVIEGTTSSTEEDQTKEPESLWERFARTLHEGTTKLTGEAGGNPIVDPVKLAEFLNNKAVSTNQNEIKNTQDNVDFLFARFEREGIDGYYFYIQALENFSKLIENLSPELRSQFMKGVFDNYKNRGTSVEKVLNRFSSKTILKILNDINSESMPVSQTVFTLLGSLSKGADLKAEAKKTVFDAKVEKNLKSLFREDINEQFLDEEYRHTLDSLVNHKTKASAETMKGIPSLQEELCPQNIELQHGRIVLALLNNATDKESQKEIRNNLFQSLNYFLETSDFAAIKKIHDHLTTKQPKADSGMVEFYQELLQYFDESEFTENVLVGLNSWDKEKLNEIQSLIQSIGYPFVPPLLALLAEEPKRTTRRFILEQLYMVAPKGPLDPILAWLTDSRWYVVRNMVLLLRTIGDHGSISHLEKNIGNSHAKVRFEIIKTFLHFQHPLGIKYLLEDLGSTDSERRFNAILLAEHSQSPGVKSRLLELLNQKGFNTVDLDTKKQIVKALTTLNHPDILPALKRILNSVSILNPGKHKELKNEITRLLASSRNVVGNISQTGSSLQEEPYRQAGPFTNLD